MNRIPQKGWGYLAFMIAIPVPSLVLFALPSNRWSLLAVVFPIAVYVWGCVARDYRTDIREDGVNIPLSRYVRWSEVRQMGVGYGKILLLTQSRKIRIPIWPFRDRKALCDFVAERVQPYLEHPVIWTKDAPR